MHLSPNNMKKLPLLFVVMVMVAVSLGFLMWKFHPAPVIPVGMVGWLASGAVVGSSEMHASDLFIEEYPKSRIRIVFVDDEWKSELTPTVIQQAMKNGVRFFITAHPSRCTLASIQLFADSRALQITTGSAAPALTGNDDFLLRIIPDACRNSVLSPAMSASCPANASWCCRDTGNPPYTDPAFATFSAELGNLGEWDIVHRKLLVLAFNPNEYRSIMAENYDVLYILAGTYQSSSGNIAQLFHYLHPDMPIVLTPWARSSAILETAGEAIDHIILPSHYPSRHQDPALNSYFRRFSARFGYEAHGMTVGVRQALELLDQAFAKGYDTPETVKQYLLSIPTHQTSLGPVSFDKYGDLASGKFFFLQNLRQELK